MNTNEHITVIFKSHYLTKALFWLSGFGILISTVIFLKIDLPIEDKFQISTTIVGLGSIIVIFLNTFEPHFIKFNTQGFKIDYMNKLLFKRGERSYLKNEIKVLVDKKGLILSNDSGRLAIIRRKALGEDDWIAVEQYFSSSKLIEN
jgi:hypothetical protein